MLSYLKNIKILTFCIILFAVVNLSAGHYKGRLLETTTNEVQPKVTVSIKELDYKIVTDKNGEFVFRRLPAGNYTLNFSGILLVNNEAKIRVEDNDDDVNVHILPVTIRDVRANEIDVYSSNRRMQKITEAPSAISVVSGKELEQATSHGQLSKTLEHIQGIDVVQSGMNDFNINTRGFNNSINRRVLVLVDGRDPSTPLINLMEWNSLQTNLSDINKIEVVRGPGSALYGANAYNGVINITTNAPKDVLGTRVSLTGGDYNTFRGDIRHAGKITDNLLFKVNVGGSSQRQSWIKSRDTSTAVYTFSTKDNKYIQTGNDPSLNRGNLEYAGLVPDVVGNRQGTANVRDIDSLINANKNATNIFASARFDYLLNENSTLLAEFGYSRYGGEYFVNQTGRILIPDVEKPFARIAYNSKNWNVQAHWNKRNTLAPQVVLNSPATSGENSNVFVIDAQWHDTFMNDNLKVVAGVNHDYQHVITAVAGSLPLISPDNIHNNFTGIYGQFEYNLLKNLQFVGATRYDRSTVYKDQFSPKAALVWTPFENHTFRATFNRSFLRPSFDNYNRSSFLGNLAQIGLPGKTPTTLSSLDDSIASHFGVNKLGLATLAQYNRGNPNLEVESAQSYEIGYKGVITEDFFVTVDIYYNQRKNFISNPLGGLAKDVYVPLRYSSDAANDSLKNFLKQNGATTFYDRLATDPKTGLPALIIAPTNIGLVDEYGVEIGVNYYINNKILLTANYSHLGFDVKENTLTANIILPNSSPNKVNFGIEYNEKTGSMPYNVNLNVRGVQGFKWIAGFFEGNVPEYWVVNLSAGVSLTKEIKLGVNVFNLLDRRHYEIFGGTYLQRVATATLAYTF